MDNTPIFTLFREVTDPSYNQVNEFYKKAFSSKDINLPSNLPEDKYNNAVDQIIQGWVLLDWHTTPERKLYLNYDQYIKDKQLAAIFIKGHSLQKVIYCSWHPDVIFYCPQFLQFTGEKDLLERQLVKSYKAISRNPESYQPNRFYADQSFFYSDDLEKTWKRLTFDTYSRLDENLFAADTLSTGHDFKNISLHLI